ncbi:MAG: hypothetical protein AB1791_10240 [Chloroflexota bacterium]
MAHRQRRSVPDVVREMVTRKLPWLPSLPQAVEVELAAFATLSDDVLWLLARSTLTEAEQKELAEWNAQAKQRNLTAEEQSRQQALVEAYDRVLVRRAQAAHLLKLRGYNLSDPAALRPY